MDLGGGGGDHIYIYIYVSYIWKHITDTQPHKYTENPCDEGQEPHCCWFFTGVTALDRQSTAEGNVEFFTFERILGSAAGFREF